MELCQGRGGLGVRERGTRKQWAWNRLPNPKMPEFKEILDNTFRQRI